MTIAEGTFGGIFGHHFGAGQRGENQTTGGPQPELNPGEEVRDIPLIGPLVYGPDGQPTGGLVNDDGKVINPPDIK